MLMPPFRPLRLGAATLQHSMNPAATASDIALLIAPRLTPAFSVKSEYVTRIVWLIGLPSRSNQPSVCLCR